MFEKSIWIWQNSNPQPDEYTEYKVDIIKKAGKKYVMSISADSNYAVTKNGEIIFFGQYSDYPENKAYDTVDITDKLENGENEIIVHVYFHGIELPVYPLGCAGVIFEVTEDGGVIAASNENTPSRLSNNYESHNCDELSCFLGYKTFYNLRGNGYEYGKSVPSKNPVREMFPRPIERLVLGERTPAKVLKYGSFLLGEGERICYKVKNSRLTYASLYKGVLTSINATHGIYVMTELERGEAGFIDIDIELENDCDIYLNYDEILENGFARVRPDRDYTIVIRGKKGRNKYTELFRRAGCKYVQVFINATYAKINYIGVRPTDYPFNFKSYDFGDELRNEIYKTSVNTMRCCTHEHYEDCPMREQALYTLDSRNEMMFTYMATGDFKFARGCLQLIKDGIHDRVGLLRLTYPSHHKICIPSYSLAYFLQMKEYIQYSGDKTIAVEAYDTLDKLEKRFSGKMDNRGVISNFTDEFVGDTTVRLWDFYAWTTSMKDDPHMFDFDAPLNAWYSIALDSYAYILDVLGEHQKAAEMRAKRDRLNKAIVDVFFLPDKKIFKSYEIKHQNIFSLNVQALCEYCGAADLIDDSNIMRVLEENSGDFLGVELESSDFFSDMVRYDVLLEKDREKYKELVLADIDRNYGFMVGAGATTFWEYNLLIDEKQRKKDSNASFCHAYVTAPLYYYPMLIKGETLEKKL